MVIGKAARQAGIQRLYAMADDGRSLNMVSPHTLSHLHAVTALDSGVLLSDLQAQLGHTDLKTTSVYLKADINHRRKIYERFKI